MGLGSSRTMSQYQLAQLAQSTGMSYAQIQQAHDLYRHFSVPLVGLTRSGYIRMYVALNPQNAIYAPEIADRAFYAFDANRNGRLNFQEFLISYQMTSGNPNGALQTAQVYAPTAQPYTMQYQDASAYTNFLHRFLAPQQQVSAQQVWTDLSPVNNAVPLMTWYNYMIYYSIFGSYLQQPYQCWPRYEALVPCQVREEVYLLTPVVCPPAEPVRCDPILVCVHEDVYPLNCAPVPQPQPQCNVIPPPKKIIVTSRCATPSSVDC